MTPEPAPIDHAKAAKAANLFISLEASWKSLANCGDPEIESRSSTYLCGVDVSRAYLALSAEIDAIAEENARLRDLLRKMLDNGNCISSWSTDPCDHCLVEREARAALDARGGA